MPRLHRLGILLLIVCLAILFAIAIPSLRSRASSTQTKTKTAQKSETKSDEGEAFRNNTLGVAYMNQQKFAEAQKYFEKALAADPKFAIARAYSRKGDADAARQHLARFQKITTEHLGSPFGAGYGDQGRFSLAELGRSGVLAAPPAIPVEFKEQPLIAAPPNDPPELPGPSTGACFLDYDGDGKPDLFLVSAVSDGTSHLLHNAGNGHFVDVTEQAGLAIKGSGLGCNAGEFDKNGHTGLAVCVADGVHLLRNKGDGKFEDVTQKVGIRREPGCVGVTFVDYDHDGDLDLYITMSPGSVSSETKRHNILWRNNGNSTFTDISVETGLGIDATGAGLVTSDFNNDRAIDFVFAGGSKCAAIYLNPREGKFSPLPGIDFTN